MHDHQSTHVTEAVTLKCSHMRDFHVVFVSHTDAHLQSNIYQHTGISVPVLYDNVRL